MKILFITTFNQQLYELSGKKMLSTFLATQKYPIMVCHEDVQLDKNERILNWNLSPNSGDFVLEQWLERNKDIIPVEFGGTCTQDLDKEIMPRYGSRFNSRASQFYRKVLAINCAVSHTKNGKGEYDFDQYIFVDCDCVFIKPISEILLESLASYDFWYHCGRWRKSIKTGIESGLFGFKPTSSIVNHTINAFESGSFKNSLRWDDGYIFREVIEQNEEINKDYKTFTCGPAGPGDKTLDLVEYLNQPTQGVVEYGPFKQYIMHLKGSHKTVLGELCY